jgi:uncharacterized metal-binding protein
MPELPERKAGIIACSGEELAEGTVTRLAALKVLQELRSRQTVTLCLPLFLAGGEGDRAFARLHPTITVDGCALRCAARATEMHSGKPAASVVVSELIAENGLGKPEGLRRLNVAGHQAVEATANRVAALVDEVLGREIGHPAAGKEAALDPTPHEEVQATCSCGSGILVERLILGGQIVEVVALPLIFRDFRKAGREPDEAAARDLLEAIKVYNSVPPEAEGDYRKAILRAYDEYCEREIRR